MKRCYDDRIYAEWRRLVRERDKHCCQMPKCKRRKRLQVHHIQKWSGASSLRYDVRNGITLCWDCHKSVTGKEHLYITLFTSIVELKYGIR